MSQFFPGVFCYSCLRLVTFVQFKIGRERGMHELLVGPNLGSSSG